MALLFSNTSVESNSSRLQFNGYFRSQNATVPAFLVQNDQNSNITTSNGRPIVWDQVIYNDGGWDSVGKQLFTAPISGVYWFYVWAMSENDGPNVNDYYTIRKNNSNSTWQNVLRVYSTGNSSHHHQWPGGTIFKLNAGDNVRVYVDRMDVGLYGKDHHYTMFQGCYLGRM